MLVRNDSPPILLTGAGFSKNFGGPLASDVWSMLLSSPKLRDAEEARQRLLGHPELDFEAVYQDLIFNEPASPAAQKLKEAVQEVYQIIDCNILSWNGDPSANRLRQFVYSFSGSRAMPGLFFTLNQDLLIERYIIDIRGAETGPALTIPGIPTPSFAQTGPPASLNEVRVNMPAAVGNEDLARGGFRYIKLHGSSNWYSAEDQAMVIGKNKPSQIKQFPLLSAYMELFRSSLTSGRHRRLICIGYSFRDEHVNNVIQKGISAGLELTVISPGDPSVLRNTVLQKHSMIWNRLAGYFQMDLGTLLASREAGSPLRRLSDLTGLPLTEIR